MKRHLTTQAVWQRLLGVYHKRSIKQSLRRLPRPTSGIIPRVKPGECLKSNKSSYLNVMVAAEDNAIITDEDSGVEKAVKALSLSP